MENEDEDQTFSVNYAKVAGEKSLLSVTRLLANELLTNPYMTIGDFLKGLNASDLELLVNVIDEGANHSNFEDLLLIAEMLANAEGLENGTLDVFTERTNQLTTFIVCESLYRKGLVKLHHENMSFGEDMKDKIIVERLDESN
jgi:hypothetical protein